MRLDFKPAENFRGTVVYRQKDNLAYAYTTKHYSVDADGAPNAYHPDDLGKHCYTDQHTGLDCLRHAGYPNTRWWNKVLVPDPKNSRKAYVQPSGPYQGYFVCMTSLRAPGGDKYATETYVDASRVPFVVIPTGFNKLPNVASQGDVGFATHLESGLTTPFIVADYGGGSDAELGESSVALFEALGGKNVNARNGAGVNKGTYQYIVFPRTALRGVKKWPRSLEDIKKQVSKLLLETPGIEPD